MTRNEVVEKVRVVLEEENASDKRLKSQNGVGTQQREIT